MEKSYCTAGKSKNQAASIYLTLVRGCFVDVLPITSITQREYRADTNACIQCSGSRLSEQGVSMHHAKCYAMYNFSKGNKLLDDACPDMAF